MKCTTILGSVSRRSGGLYESVRALCLHLQEAGVEMQVLGLRDADTDSDIDAWDPVPIQAHRTVGPRTLGYAPSLRRALEEQRPDLTHVHGLWTYSSHTNRAASGKANRPYIISPRGMLDPWALANSRWKKRLAATLFEQAHLQGAACIHALCEPEAEAIRGFGISTPICIIPNGVTIPQEAVDAAPPWAGNVSHDVRVLLFLGRLHPKKGLAPLIDAWDALQRDTAHPAKGWHLIIAGWGQEKYEAQLRSRSRSHGSESSISFTGPLFGAAKQAALHHASAFVLPSLSEGLPMSVLEAWSHGLPVVMTPECNIPAGFENGAALPAAATKAGIESSLRNLFSMQDEERTTMGRAGQQLAADQFNWESIASRMKSVYDWVCTGGTPPDCVVQDQALGTSR